MPAVHVTDAMLSAMLRRELDRPLQGAPVTAEPVVVDIGRQGQRTHGIRSMRCYVYKSLRKPDTYLYLRGKGDFTALPEPLLASLGRIEFVLELDLVPGRNLARADALSVKSDLEQVGFYLQLPPRADRPLIEPTF